MVLTLGRGGGGQSIILCLKSYSLLLLGIHWKFFCKPWIWTKINYFVIYLQRLSRQHDWNTNTLDRVYNHTDNSIFTCLILFWRKSPEDYFTEEEDMKLWYPTFLDMVGMDKSNLSQFGIILEYILDGRLEPFTDLTDFCNNIKAGHTLIETNTREGPIVDVILFLWAPKIGKDPSDIIKTLKDVLRKSAKGKNLNISVCMNCIKLLQTKYWGYIGITLSFCPSGWRHNFVPPTKFFITALKSLKICTEWFEHYLKLCSKG